MPQLRVQLVVYTVKNLVYHCRMLYIQSDMLAQLSSILHLAPILLMISPLQQAVQCSALCSEALSCPMQQVVSLHAAKYDILILRTPLHN